MMSWTAIGRAGGPIQYRRNADLVTLAEGEFSATVDDIHDGEMTFSETGVIVPMPVPLATLKAQRWADAKVYRSSKLSAGVTTAKGVVQSDDNSQRIINQFADSATRFKLSNQIAALSAIKVTAGTWSVGFVMKDNTIIQHNGDEMIAMAETVNTYILACQTASQAVRAAIFAATTAAAVSAINIAAGYPA